MLCQNFLKISRAKKILLITIGIIIFASGSLADNVIYCIQAPCPQMATTVIGEKIYSVFTFNRLFINTQFALAIKNFFQPTLSAGTTYFILSFIISIIIWYLLISLIMCVYHFFSKTPMRSV